MELVEENLCHSSEKRKRTDHKEEEVSVGDDFEDWKRKILAGTTK